MRAGYDQDWPLEHNVDLHHRPPASEQASNSCKRQPGLWVKESTSQSQSLKTSWGLLEYTKVVFGTEYNNYTSVIKHWQDKRPTHFLDVEEPVWHSITFSLLDNTLSGLIGHKGIKEGNLEAFFKHIHALSPQGLKNSGEWLYSMNYRFFIYN